MHHTFTFLLFSLLVVLQLISSSASAQDGTTCAQAIPVTTGGNGGTVFSTCDGLNNFSAPGPNSCFDQGALTTNYADGKDLYLTFTPPITGCYNIIPYDYGGVNIPGIFVYSGCPVAGNCVGGNVQLLDGISLQGGVPYTIVISSDAIPIFGNCLDFKLYISDAATAPANDFCQNAIPLEGLGTNYNATSCQEPDAWAPGGCQGNGWSSNENGVWYTFTNPSNQNFAIAVNNIECVGINGAANLLQLGIWSANSCNLGNDTFYGCLGATGNATLNINNLPAGDYYLFVDGNAGALCTWGFTSPDICIPPTVGITAVNPSCGQTNGTVAATVSPTPAPSGYSYSYSWSGTGGFTSNVKNPTNLLGPGTYTVTVTQTGNGLSCTATESVTLTNPSGLSPTANNNGPICSSTAAVNVSLTANPGGSGATGYSWSGPGFGSAIQNPTLTIPANTPAGNYTYTVTVTATGGCTATASTTVVVNTTTATANNNGPACQGEVIALSSSGGTGYQWTGPNSFSSAQQNPNVTIPNNAPAANYTYTVTVTGAGGCTATASTTIVVTTVTATASNNGPLCGSGGNVTLTASGGTTYTWNDGAPPTIANTASTTIAVPPGTPANSYPYYVTVSDANGCSSTASTNVVVNNATATAANNGPICSSATAAATVNLTATGGGTYAWAGNGLTATSGAATSANVPANTPAGNYTYTVTVTNNGCTSTATTVVVVNNATATAANDGPLCSGTSATTVNLTATGGGTYAWAGNGLTATSGAATSANVPANTPAGNYTYTVTVTNNGCTSTANTVVVVNNAIATAANDGPVCSGTTATTVNLTATGGGTYSWAGNGLTATSGAATSANVPANTPAGNYTYTVTVTNNGCTSTATTVVVVNTATATANNNGPICSGATATTINLTATGGGTYAWAGNNLTATSGAATSANIPANTPAGNYTYTVTVTNNGCTSTATTVVVVNNATATAANDGPLCSGTSATTVNLTATGGGTYAWAGNNLTATSGAATSANVPANTPAGNYTYTVTVTNNGCTSTATTVVVVNNATATAANNGPICSSATAAATVNLTATGGGTYAWAGNGLTATSGAATSANVPANTPAGNYTYTVTVTNNGCTSTATTVVVVNNATATAANDGPLCSGTSATTVNLTATGGGTYAWAGNALTATSGAATSATIAPNTAAGNYTYTVTVTNNGCTSTATTVVVVNNATATAANDGPVCSGTTATSVSLTATGGDTYSWAGNNLTATSGANTSANVPANTPAGNYTYTVTVTNNGCTSTATTVVIVNTIAASATVVQPTCANGGNSGSIDVTVTDGTPAFTFAWLPALPATEDPTNVGAGTYTVTVSDAASCSTTTSVTLNLPGSVSLSITATDVTCNGGNNGSATVVATNGVPPYTYAWAPSGGNAATANSLVAGTYTVTVSDVNSCTQSTQITIAEPTLLTAAIVPTNIACNGNDGALDVTANGGTPAYSYAWNGGLGSTQDPQNATTGTYIVTVTDANSCSITATATITEPAALTANIAATNVSCNGADDADIDLTVSGGTTPYSYSWTPALPAIQDPQNVAANSYTVIISDDNGCTTSAQTQITEPTPLNLVVSTTPASCNNTPTGGIDLTVNGGQTPYSFAWSGGLPAQEDNFTASANNYTVTVTDANGCSATIAATVAEPAAMVINLLPSNVSCNGAANGSITTTINGGIAPYSFDWNNGADDVQNPNNLLPNIYTLTLTDDNGCTASAQTQITEPAAISLSVTTVDATCGTLNGSATATATGGSGGFSYQWQAPIGSLTATANGLGAGSYAVTVSDQSGCTAVEPFGISNANGPDITNFVVDNATCEQSNGSISLTVTGGTNFTWSPNVSTGSTAQNLAPNTYNVTVSDANGCSAVGAYTIDNEASPQLQIASSQDATCGVNNGSITLLATGGTGALTYNWLPNVSSNITAANLGAGVYAATVTDVNGCTDNVQVTITQTTNPIIQVDAVVDATCGQNNGAITISVTGGSGNESYAWAGGVSNANVANSLTAGTYTVTVTSNGCTDTETITVNDLPAPQVVLVSSTDPACGQSNGSIIFDASGGNGTLSYTWTNSASNTEAATNLTAATYTITVTDASGCTATASNTIANQSAPSISNPTATEATCGQSNGTAGITVTGGVLPLSYTWTNNVSTSNTANNLPALDYTVTVSDANGCSATVTISVISPNAPVLSLTNTTPETCNLGNGAIDVAATGGVLPLTYAWTGGVSNTNTASNLNGGNYTVTVTDNNGCSDQLSITVDEFGSPTIAQQAVTPATCGIDNGNISTIAANGTQPYIFTWTGAVSTTASAIDLAAGSYTITVTDANSCASSVTVTVDGFASPQIASNTITPETCGNANGSIAITTNGGTGLLGFVWSPNVGNTETINNLAAGDYSVTVSDANFCTDTAIFTVVNVAAPTTQIDQVTDANCGQANGSASIIVNGGTGAMSFVWDGSSSTTNSATGLAAGSYAVTVTDGNGCTAVQPVSISNLGAPSITIVNIDDATCGQANGAAQVTASGGNGALTFAWSGGIADTDGTVSGLSANTYFVTVSDANNCQAVETIVINDLAAPTLIEDVISPATCGQANGSASVFASGGNGALVYVWSGGVGSANNQANNLDAGDYSVTVSDENQCTATVSLTVPLLGAPVITGNSSSPAICGQANGVATVTATGVGTLSYTWQNNTSITDQATDLAAGDYAVTVTDNTTNCTTSIVITIGSAAASVVAIDTIIHATCGNNNGSALIDVEGLSSNYTYEWTDNVSTNIVATDLAAGNYSVTVTDQTGCTTVLPVVVDAIATPTVSLVSVTNASCGLADGVIVVAATASTDTLFYDWTDAVSTNETASGLLAGSYTVTVTDDNNCTVLLTAIVANNNGPSVSTTNGTTGCGLSEGTVSANGTGGTGTLDYAWNSTPAQNTAVATALPVGIYTVTVTDDNGCVAIGTATVVGEISDPIVSCGSSTETTVTFVWDAVLGAIGYEITVNGTTQSLASTELQYTVTGLAAETSVTISVVALGGVDCGNSNPVSFTCNTLPAGCPTIVPQISIADSTLCLTESPINLTATPAGGVFSGTGVSGNTFNPTVATVGAYTLTYTYTNPDGCVYVATHSITVVPMPVASFILGDVVCTSETTSITFNGTPTSNATYSWAIEDNAPQTGSSITTSWAVVGQKDVVLTVTTNDGCVDELTQTIGVSNVTAQTVADQSIILGSSIALPVTAQSGLQGSLSYTWTPADGTLSCNNCISPQANPTQTTTYNVLVTDEYGCEATDNVTVAVKQENTLIIPNAFSPNGDLVNDVFHVLGANITEFDMSIFDRWGQKVYETKSNSIADGWNGLYPDGTPAEIGVYVYQLKVTFSDNKTEFAKGNVTLFWQIQNLRYLLSVV